MPRYTYLQVDLPCPSCGTIRTDMLWFQWGFCPGYLPRTQHIYRVGDAIIWKACKDGSIPAWTYFEQKDEAGGTVDLAANIGDPSFLNLIIHDPAQESFLQEPCPTCHGAFGGAAIELKEGIISGAWMYLLDELHSQAITSVIGPDGVVTPMPEWDDHLMDHRPYDC
jgi:hypothetical protein